MSNEPESSYISRDMNLVPRPLTKFTDGRGTICIAETGTEVPYDIQSVTPYTDKKGLSTHSNFTVIVARGNLTLSLSRGEVSIEEDHYLHFSEKENIIDSQLSEGGVAIMILHNSYKLTDQSSADDGITYSIDECRTYSSAESAMDCKVQLPGIQRVFYIKNVKDGSVRGEHAHTYCHQAMTAIAGSFKVILNDGSLSKDVSLDSSNITLHIPPYVWAKEMNFAQDAICLVVASHRYDRSGYIDKIDSLKKIRSEIYG